MQWLPLAPYSEKVLAPYSEKVLADDCGVSPCLHGFSLSTLISVQRTKTYRLGQVPTLPIGVNVSSVINDG